MTRGLTARARLAALCFVSLACAPSAFAAGEYDNPNEGLQPYHASELDPRDTDGDGIPQLLEFQLARQFMPTIWFHRWEGCAEPAGNKSHVPINQPGRLVYRVSPHPENPAAISIQYVLLYARDCGNAFILGLDRHSGDAEPFSITLVPNASCKHGYGIHSVRTWGHEGTGAEVVNTDIHTGQCRWGFSNYSVNHDRPDGRIVVSLSKHANFLDVTECNTRFFIEHSCKKDWTPADRNLWVGGNVGEQAMPLITNLAGLDFSREVVWLGQDFCGNLSRDSNCPGPIERKWSLHAPAPSTSTGGGGGGGDDCGSSRAGCLPSVSIANRSGASRVTTRALPSRRATSASSASVQPLQWNDCALANFGDMDRPADEVTPPACAAQ